MAREGDVVVMGLDRKERLCAEHADHAEHLEYPSAPEDVNRALAAWRRSAGRRPWLGVPCWEELLLLMMKGAHRKLGKGRPSEDLLYTVVRPLLHGDTEVNSAYVATTVRPVWLDPNPALGLSVGRGKDLTSSMTKREWRKYVDSTGCRLPINPLPTKGDEGGVWLQIDDGLVNTGPSVPFGMLSTIREIFCEDPPLRVERGEIIAPSRFTSARFDRLYLLDPVRYLATHLAPFSFETLLRTLIAMGVMTNAGVLDDPQVWYVKLSQGGLSVPMQSFAFHFVLGADAPEAQHCFGRVVLGEANGSEVIAFPTLEDLWKRFGDTVGMNLATYLKFRERGYITDLA